MTTCILRCLIAILLILPIAGCSSKEVKIPGRSIEDLTKDMSPEEKEKFLKGQEAVKKMGAGPEGLFRAIEADKAKQQAQ